MIKHLVAIVNYLTELVRWDGVGVLPEAGSGDAGPARA